MLKTLYERAISEADKRRFNGESGAEEALRSFWTGYVDFLVHEKFFSSFEQRSELTYVVCRERKMSMANSCFSSSVAACGASRLRANCLLDICASW